MLPVIPYNAENFTRNAPTCARCGQLNAPTGICGLGGIHHGAHANSGYCPQGDFGPGSNVKPEVWDEVQQGRIDTCRSCVAFAKYHCGNDGINVMTHARLGICPMGNYPDGTTGEIPQSPDATAAAPSGKCCGG